MEQTIPPAHESRWHWLGLLPGVTGLLILALRLLDPQTYYWTAATGQWMLTHGTFVRHDHFSYALHGAPIITNEWAFDWFSAVTGRVFGTFAPDAIVVITVLLSVAALAWYLRELGASISRIGWLTVFFAVMSVSQFDQARALGFSFAFFAAELAIVTRSRRHPWVLTALAPLFALWINVHGSALLGVVVLGLAYAWTLVPVGRVAWLERAGSPRPLGLALAASVLALGATPWGFAMVVYDVRMSLNPALMQWIAEWRSPDLQNPYVLLVMLTPLGLLARALWRHRAPALEFSLVVVMTLSFMRAIRMIDYLVVAVLALAVFEEANPERRQLLSAPATRLAAAIASVFIVFSVFAPTHVVSHQPSNAVMAKLAQLPPGRVLATYNWTDALMASGYQTYVDARTDLFLDNGLFEQFMALNNGLVSPDVIARRYDVRYVLWAPGFAVTTFLYHDPAWRVVWRDSKDVLFARRGFTSGPSGRVANFTPILNLSSHS